ncbi:MAG TPA: DUF302 domain-containing protein [Candidatus Baltobacteraceae bacterium]|jgi:hypothetical protein|nr:DUF302 domain-containing protein [Candidatus Baltobacteraceae bacterium]
MNTRSIEIGAGRLSPVGHVPEVSNLFLKAVQGHDQTQQPRVRPHARNPKKGDDRRRQYDFADIDQSAAAAQAGLTLRPTTLLVFGNPKGGTPLMEAFPAFGLELPLKILVWEDPSGVMISNTPLKESAARYKVTGMEERIDAIDRAVDALLRLVM